MVVQPEGDAVTGLAPLPEDFVARLARIVPAARLDAVLARFAEDTPTAFRVNTLRAGVAEVSDLLRAEGLLLTPVPWFGCAFTVPHAQRAALTAHPAAGDGRIYVQSLSSMAAALALEVSPGETVLDLAAAPGGKTTLLAAQMKNEGALSAVEPVRDRFFRLRATLDRMGVTIAKTYAKDGCDVGALVPERFDRVLLDAPCSSESRFDRRDPGSMAHWRLRKVREMARKQARLIRSGFEALKPGGTMVYSTCSFSPEENEAVVDGLLREVGDAAEVDALPLPVDAQPGLTAWDGEAYDPRLSRAARILPDAVMDGFFVCRLMKLRSTARPQNWRGARRG